MAPTFALERFVTAQAPVFSAVRAELLAGAKRTHWMWFIFPQLKGLGLSAMAQTYGIGSLQEAEAYRADPVLGPRLVGLFEIVLRHANASARAIFGSPDDIKL